MKQKQFLSVRDLCICAMGAALISVCAWISVPLTSISFTMQSFAVFFLTGLLGLKRGMMSLVAYLLIGFAGIPVFSGFRSGPGVLLGATGGYLIGFLFAVLIVGLLTKKFGRSFRILVLSMVVGAVAYYAFGSVWYLFLYMDAFDWTAISTVFLKCVVPFLLPDFLKILCAAALIRRLDGHLQL